MCGSKVFFFEKKKQKTFIRSGCGLSGQAQPRLVKVFWFFFSKKNMLPERSGDTMLMHAVAGLVLHPLIPNIQTRWVKRISRAFAAAPQDRGTAPRLGAAVTTH
jgi:hypothetical protein